MGMHVVVIGSPFDGQRIVGPFATGEEAIEWAEQNIRNEDWWAVPLLSTEQEAQ